MYMATRRARGSNRASRRVGWASAQPRGGAAYKVVIALPHGLKYKNMVPRFLVFQSIRSACPLVFTSDVWEGLMRV